MNVANFITDRAENSGDFPAIIQKQSTFLGIGKDKEVICSFDELEKKINTFANAFSHNGITSQDRVLVLVPTCVDLIAITFSLFKIGATPVFIDPGMGVDKLLENIKNIEATALIGISKAILLKKMKAKYFSSIKTIINVDGGLVGKSLKKILKDRSNVFDAYSYKEDDVACIVYTSGATGPSKGVEYSMRMFIEQTTALKEMLGLVPEENDLSGFPLFALFSLAIGLTTYLPESIDARAPASTNGKKLAAELQKNNIHFANGSPSIWAALSKYLLSKKKKIETLKKLAMFGAPVSHELITDLKKVLPNCQIFTPYGATESLPVSLISDEMIRKETASLTKDGRGVCVGYVYKKVKVEIRNQDQYSNLDQYGAGEIWVSSPMTSKKYFKNEEANKNSKDLSTGELFHFIGDLGYIDDWGRLWYLGRSKHALKSGDENLYSIEVEGVFDSHPKIIKSALVSVNDEPSLAVKIVENKKMGDFEKEEFFKELKVFAKNFKKTKHIKNLFVVESFPLDTRHNIKIDRTELGSSLEKSES